MISRTIPGRGHGPRVLLYSQDGLGLGHLRRTSSIAGALVDAHADATVLTIVDSPLGPFFRGGPGQDCVKLPSIVKTGPGAWQSLGLSQPFDEVSGLRTDLLRTIGSSFRPDLFLVDHMPHGAMGELLPLLDEMRDLPSRPTCVLGLRDIVDAPEVVKRVWLAEGALAALESHYDAVFVYGQQDVFDPVLEYDFPQVVAERVHFTGYVCTPERGRYTSTVRGRATKNGTRLLVATAGGGADAYPMMGAVLDALPVLRAHDPWSAVLITGPFMPPELRRDLERRAARTTARVRPFVSDPLSYVEAADVVVAMAGYSSTVEAIRSRTPTVLVPRRGPSAEQRMRTSRFAARDWVCAVDPDDLTGEAVAAAVLESASRSSGQAAPEPRGLSTAVQNLLALLDGQSPAARAPAPMEDGGVAVPAG